MNAQPYHSHFSGPAFDSTGTYYDFPARGRHHARYDDAGKPYSWRETFSIVGLLAWPVIAVLAVGGWLCHED